MTQEEADAAVDFIFDDLRNRKFLKWIFMEDPGEASRRIAQFVGGGDVFVLDKDIQAEIRKIWAQLIIKATNETRGGDT